MSIRYDKLRLSWASHFDVLYKCVLSYVIFVFFVFILSLISWSFMGFVYVEEKKTWKNINEIFKKEKV